MDRFPSDTQTILLTMSVLPDFTLQTAQQLSSLDMAADILEQLHKSRYFIERREDRLGWYRFHPLFQEFLLRRAEQMWSRAALDDRLEWTAFAAREAEARGFSWAYWEFDAGFGAYTDGQWNELHESLIP